MKLKENQEYRLLVVDDNEINRELMSLQLRRNGFKVTLASGGVEALDILKTASFDIILLDIMMPEMNGIEVLEKIREEHSILQLPVIMVTADDHEDSIIDSLQKGANDYLIKPLNMPVTAARIRTQLMTKALATIKDEFVEFASHDLKKPLILMLDIIDSLKQPSNPQTTDSDDSTDSVSLLESTVLNMQDVVENFLKIDHLESGQAVLSHNDVQLNSIVQSSVSNNLKYAEKKGIHLIADIKSDLPIIDADAFRVTQVLDNLIGNAVKFSPANSKTIVRTHQDKDFVYAEITDGGPGLLAEDIAHLFVRHAHLSNKPTGSESSSGIGLSLAKQMIDLHQGHIGARNNVDQGTTFWFSLPIHKKAG